MSVAPQETMIGLIGGFWIARSIYLAAKLGIADHFDDAPKSIAQLAAATETDPQSLYRLMRALASVDIFTEVSDRYFALTPLAQTLQTDVPNSLRYLVIAQMGYDHSLIILKNCHQAMSDRGKLLLFEGILPPGNEPSPIKFFDMIMLLLTGGQERTQEGYRSLLRSNGFELTRVISTPSLVSIIEAVKL